MELGNFRDWLAGQLSRAASDPAFLIKRELASIRNRYRDKLNHCKRRIKSAMNAYSKWKRRLEYEEAIQKQTGLTQAVAGLTEAVSNGKASQEKLDQYIQKLAAHKRAIAKKRRGTPVGKKLQSMRAYRDFKDAKGITALEDLLTSLLRNRGKSSVRAGNEFELIAKEAVEEVILPKIRETAANAKLYSSLRLKSSRAEFDHVVLSEQGSQQPAAIHAIAEAKRNINELASGFQARQENLGWFKGVEAFYDHQTYVNKQFPSGNFDQVIETIKIENRKDLVDEILFDRSSFSQFMQNSDGNFLKRLYFISRNHPLDQAHSSTVARLLNRIAWQPRFDIDEDRRIRALHQFVLEIRHEMQTDDVMRLYLDAGLADHIILVEK